SSSDLARAQALNRLEMLNIGYFLRPNWNHPFYSTCEELLNSTVLGSILVDAPESRLIKNFTFVTLYELLL
ncbi:hypothetical protein MUP77_02550, partial [Candidatus Bathyarchaeota archaeon]|nr:hypothetical protein [Candidatus Bathyarchaeota archaeon]